MLSDAEAVTLFVGWMMCGERAAMRRPWLVAPLSSMHADWDTSQAFLDPFPWSAEYDTR